MKILMVLTSHDKLGDTGRVSGEVLGGRKNETGNSTMIGLRRPGHRHLELVRDGRGLKSTWLISEG